MTEKLGVTLIDGNNWLRRKYEEASSMSLLRSAVIDLRNELARPNQRTILVWDGFNANAYRRAIYPPYKGKRAGGTPDEFFRQIKLLKSIIPFLPIYSITIPEYEADDVIAELAQEVIGKDWVRNVHIKSTDKDFEQIEGASHEGKRLSEATGLDIPSSQIVLFKTLVGDTSDNIAGVPGFGKGKWTALDKPVALSWLDHNFESRFQPLMPAKLTSWCEENQDTLIAMRDVCYFRPVPDVTSYAKSGNNNPDEVERILKENLA